jgi:ABC-type glycerol-3-phosphate transport system substrate-binding protein
MPDGSKQYGFYTSSSEAFILQEVGCTPFVSGTLRLDSEPVVRTLQWYADLALQEKVMPTYGEYRAQWRQSGNPILLGRVGMWLDAATFMAGRWNDPQRKFAVGVAPLPRRIHNDTFFNIGALVIPAKAQSAKDAWQWIAFLSDHSADLLNELTLPARRSAVQKGPLPAYISQEQADAFLGGLEKATRCRSSQEMLPYFAPLYEAEQWILVGDETVQEGLSKAQQKVDAARK